MDNMCIGDFGASLSAASGQIRNRFDSVRSGSKFPDKLNIGDRSNILGPDQLEPIENISVGIQGAQACFGEPTFGSWPAINRSIFARCFQITNKAKPMNIGIMAYSPNPKATIGTDAAANIPPTDE